MASFPRSLIRFLLTVIFTAALAGLWAIIFPEDKVFFLMVLVITFATIAAAAFTNLERVAFVAIAAMIPIRLSVNLAAPAKYARGNTANGFVLSITDCIILVLLVAWGRRLLFFNQPIKLYPKFGLLILALTFFVVLGGIRLENDLPSGGNMIFHFLLGISLFYYILNNRHPLKSYFFHSATVCCMLVFEGLLGIIQQATGSNAGMEFLGAPTTKMESNVDSRVLGTVPSSNMLGAIVSLMIVHPVAIFFCSMRRYKLPALGILLLAFVTILGTKSRGVWLSSTIIFSYGLYQMFRIRFSALRSSIGVGWLLTFVLLVAFLIPGTTDRITREDNGSIMARAYMNQIAMNMIEAKPFIGFGWNNYTLYFHEYDDTAIGHSYLFPYVVHNGYLFVGVEYGLAAMFLILWIWLKVIRSTLRIRPRGMEYQQLMAFFFPWIFLGRMMQTPLYINNPITSLDAWYALAMCLLFKEWCDEEDQLRAKGGTPESIVNQV